MKTCPNCQTSLPDFLNICTKCKFNLASPPPVKPVASSAPPAPSSSSTPPRVVPTPSRVTPSSSSAPNAPENHRVEPPKETLVSAPQKSNKTMYIVGGVIVLIAVAWLGLGRSGSDEARLAKEQAATEVAKAKAEASEAQQQAKKARAEAASIQRQNAEANKPAVNPSPKQPIEPRNTNQPINTNKPWYQQ